MTEMLKKTFDAAARLPEDEQDAVAEWLLAELAPDEKWRGHFVETQDALSVFGQEARVEQ